ncbi:MAG: hypothetical protein WBZ14_14770, partial [Terriglobales bacterium]
TSICRSIVTICSGLYLWMGMTVFPPSGFSLIPPGTNLAGHVMTRFFRHKYATFKGADKVEFMVGSVIPGRPKLVERAAAARLIYHAFTSRPSGSINGLSSRLAAILTAQTPYVILTNEPTGLFYVLKAPDFTPSFAKPFEYRAIGSGDSIVDEMGTVSDQIFAGMDSVHHEAMWLGASMTHFLNNKNIPSVGGMFTMVKLGARGAMPITRQTGRIPHGPFFELAYENRRWVQRNVTTGKEIRLRLPWEIDHRERQEYVFDDLRVLHSSHKTA